jgi:hypothetical protein
MRLLLQLFLFLLLLRLAFWLLLLPIWLVLLSQLIFSYNTAGSGIRRTPAPSEPLPLARISAFAHVDTKKVFLPNFRSGKTAIHSIQFSVLESKPVKRFGAQTNSLR